MSARSSRARAAQREAVIAWLVDHDVPVAPRTEMLAQTSRASRDNAMAHTGR